MLKRGASNGWAYMITMNKRRAIEISKISEKLEENERVRIETTGK
jgi:hypothetical protein